MDPLGDLLDRLLRFEEIVMTLIAQEDVFLEVAPPHHMADAAGILDSRFSRHVAISTPWADGCKHIYAPNNRKLPELKNLFSQPRPPPSSQLEALNLKL